MNQQPVEFIKMVAAEAANNAEAVLSDLLPHGRRHGKEWLANNPTRDDRNPSLSVNTLTGQWNDPASQDKGGDLVSLAAYVGGTDQYEGAKQIAGMLGISHEAHKPNPERAAEIARKVADAKRKREAVEKSDHERAIVLTQNILQNARRAPTANAYALRKGITPAEAYEAPQTQAYQCSRDGKPEQFTVNKGDLLIPVYVNKKQVTLQVIRHDGAKHFLTGGNTKGGYLRIGQPIEGGRIYICEGYATGRSIHEATGACVVVAFNAGNIPHVMRWLTNAYLKAEYVIAADNDNRNVCHRHKTEGATEAVSPVTERQEWCKCNPGLTAATKAARELGALVSFPNIEGGKDWNDVHKLKGLDEVRAQIGNAVTVTPALAVEVVNTPGQKPVKTNPSGLSALYALPTPAIPKPDAWPEPEAIDNSLCAVAALSPDILPEPMREWFNDIAERMQCNIDYVAVSAIVSLSSVVGAGCGVRPKQRDDWEVVPNLWGGAVGRPSTLKTPALNAAMRPLLDLERKANQEYDTASTTHEVNQFAKDAAIAKVKEDLKRAKTDAQRDQLKFDYARLLESTPPPTWKRYKTNNPTQEKLCELLTNNPRGLLYFRDELMGFFSSLDKDGKESDRAFYLEAWNGNGPFTADTISRGTTHVDNLCVSLLGSIQPAKLTGYLYRAMRGNDNDGLVQRLQLLVYPDEVREWQYVDRKPNATAAERAMRIYSTLADMDFTQHGASRGEFDKRPWFRFSPEAQELFTAWLTDLESNKLRGDSESIVTEHLSKYRSLMPSLALLFHLVDIADGKAHGAITLRAATLAAEWCDYLESHARRIYGIVSNIVPRAAAVLLSKIKTGALPDPFKTTHVYRPHWELLDKANADEVCEYLAALGYLRDVTPPYPGYGRPPAAEYAINPKVKPRAQT